MAQYRDEPLGFVSPATIRRELVILSHHLSVARKVWGLAGLGNPVQSIRLPSGGEFPGIAVRRGEIS
ncbi:hypothetical protein ACSYAY_00275 [Leptospirillum ferriphilum]|uniref:hypothetical protein n=1 Tax=Leptospirillum ferriphilum TaxID=178606 RepID=UPI003EE5FF7E